MQDVTMSDYVTINSRTDMINADSDRGHARSQLSPTVPSPTNDGEKLKQSINSLPAELIRKIIQPVLDEALNKDVYLGQAESRNSRTESGVNPSLDAYVVKRSGYPLIPGEDHDAGICAFRLLEAFVTAASRFAILGGPIRNDVFAYMRSQRVVWASILRARIASFLDSDYDHHRIDADKGTLNLPTAIPQSQYIETKPLASFRQEAECMSIKAAILVRKMFRHGTWKAVVHMLRQSSSSGLVPNFAPWDQALSIPITIKSRPLILSFNPRVAFDE